MHTFPKRVAWAVIDQLPTNFAVLVLHRLFGMTAAPMAVRNHRYELGAYLKLHQILSRAPQSQWHRAILIGGPARIGKSTLADTLATELGAAIVRLDDFKNIFRKLRRDEQISLNQRLVERAISAKKGVIIEGDDLITYADARIEIEQPPVELDVLLHSRSHFGAISVAIGSADDDPRKRASAIITSAQHRRCWAVNRLSAQEIQDLSQRIVLMSQDLRERATAEGIPYFNLITENYDASLRSTANTIIGFSINQPRPFYSIARRKVSAG